MKSIVLCERTIVHKSEDFTALKDCTINDESKEKAEKKIINGISESKKSETVINNIREAGKSNHHGSDDISGTLDKESSEDDGNKNRSSKELENGFTENSTLSGTESSMAIEKNNLCSVIDEKDCLKAEFSIEDKIAESGGQSSSGRVQDLKFNRKRNFTVLKVEPCDKTLENEKNIVKVMKEKKAENALEISDKGPSKISFVTDPEEEKAENEQPIVNIDLDVDENKENEKEDKRNQIDEFSGNEPLNRESNGCVIQVGDVQSITGSEKDCIWAENDFKSSQNQKEATSDKFTGISQDVLCLNEGPTEIEKESQELETDENVVFEAEENAEEVMEEEEENEDEIVEEVDQEEEEMLGEGVEVEEGQVEVEAEEEEEEEGESERAQEVINEEKKNYPKGLNKLSRGKTTSVGTKNNSCQQKKENMISRKRQLSDSGVLDSSATKKRCSRGSEEEVRVQSEDENLEDSSRCEDLASLDAIDVSSEDRTSSLGEKLNTKRAATDDEKNGKKPKFSIGNEELKTETKFSILEGFRGTLKTLTRSDLEELIVQKLCEVITERSNVGELRRRAQALEQDQERWKAKVQSLTKQMREMEMVMKKYMTEVQKQVKEGDTHVVTPLKVTRSVGLQVSFYSNASKSSKPVLSQPSTPPSPAQNLNVRNAKGTPPKLSSQLSPANQNLRSKAPSFPKNSPTLQKSPAQLQRRSIVPKPDYLSSQSNRTMQQTVVNSGRGVPNQLSRTTYKSISGMTTTTTTTTTTSASTAQQQQQQQQNGSKVIDLTDDDDRQTGNVVKTSGSIRVVNHLSQAPGAQSNRFTYFLPTTSATTAPSGGQSRQVLIATPTMPQPSRQIMCSMPPLLFKGGNVVQSGSQSHVINNNNKVILPKALRHPAPLPQQPINQNTRPNLKLLPPRPALKISKVQTGIVLSWNMSLSPEHAPIASYQLYAYQESNCPPSTSLWKKVGDVKALPLPMACTLTQFMSGHKYHFAVRAVDLHSRIGPFSFPGTIVLVK